MGANANEVSVKSFDFHSFPQWFDHLVKPRDTFTNACNPDLPHIQEGSNIEKDDIDENVSVFSSCSRRSKVESQISTNGKWCSTTA